MGQLNAPVDHWLCFLENGATLDADALPERLDRPEQRSALVVLDMLVRSELEREKYEARLRDRLEIETLEELRDEPRRDCETALEQLEDQKWILADIIRDQDMIRCEKQEALRKGEEQRLAYAEALRERKEESILLDFGASRTGTGSAGKSGPTARRASGATETRACRTHPFLPSNHKSTGSRT